MFRKLAVPLFTLAAVAAALAAPGGASTSETLQFVNVQKQFSIVPSGQPQVGSRTIFTSTIYNRVSQFGKPAGALVGHTEVVCTIVSRTAAQCLVTAHVPNGQIVAAGAMVTRRGPATNHFAITGGAGAYGTVRGTVVSRDLSPTRSLVVLHLTS
jgi:hypothetical protein